MFFLCFTNYTIDKKKKKGIALIILLKGYSEVERKGRCEVCRFTMAHSPSCVTPQVGIKLLDCVIPCARYKALLLLFLTTGSVCVHTCTCVCRFRVDPSGVSDGLPPLLLGEDALSIIELK